MSNRKVIFGLVLVLIGLLLLGNSVGVFYFDFGDFVRLAIPLALIVAGGWLIIRRRQKEAEMARASYEQTAAGGATPGSQQNYGGAPPPPPPSSPPPQAGQANGTGRMRYNKTFGDMFIDLTGTSLLNVEVSSMFGDTEIKLHGGELQPGLNRMIVSGFLGDLRVLVPPEMPVMVHASSFAGDIDVLGRRSDGFGNNIELQTENYKDAERRLFIAVNHFLGDIRIYQV
ncbi:hypothetical protein GF420_00050 [candidate division GN15 bacterium]|nr:hypothetical protein [candidate division GN15 bacterium]